VSKLFPGLRSRLRRRALKPCKKATQAQQLSIEQRWPVLVTDYHPVAGGIDPNSVSDELADETARKIVREYSAWLKANPDQDPKNKPQSLQDLKDMEMALKKETDKINLEGKKFKRLAKQVDLDHAEDLRKEALKKKLAEQKIQKAKDAADAATKLAAAKLKAKADAVAMAAKVAAAKAAAKPKTLAAKAKEALKKAKPKPPPAKPKPAKKPKAKKPKAKGKLKAKGKGKGKGKGKAKGKGKGKAKRATAPVPVVGGAAAAPAPAK